MMKISKPTLTHDFILGPFQFTSLNSILFKNVKNVYEANEKIILEYEHSSKIESSNRDWIGIFPRGWSTLQQYVTFEWVSQSLPSQINEQNKENGDTIRRTITFLPKFHLNTNNNNSFYQFVYVSKQIEVLGVSSYFRVDPSTTDTNLELECLVPVSSRLRTTSVSDFGGLIANNKASSTSIDTKTLQTASIHSLQNMNTDTKNWPKQQVPTNIPEMKKLSIFARKSTGTGDLLDPYSSHSEPVFPMSFPLSHCKKCFNFKRSGDFLRSQQILQSKVGPRSKENSVMSGQSRTLGLSSSEKLKIVMERNKVLEERAQEMKKEMEKIQAESKKLKMSFYNTNKEKVAYEKFVKDFIKSLEKDSIVRVVNGSTEILVKKVNYVGMEEHPRDKKTSKRERELKAVIGLQEITIRNLINSLQEKAKSVQELNQTVKLAQVFSAAAEESRDCASDVEEEGDDASNSDSTSEYEFSLTKPQPPEEITVEDTDAELDDIRRATETELKDIGINRSLGKSPSRDSQLPDLSVHSYSSQNEGTRPKKPRLFDNVEDCWPHSETDSTSEHRQIMDPCTSLEPDSSMEEQNVIGESESNMESSCSIAELKSGNETDNEQTGFENFYDACEAFNTSMPNKEVEDSTAKQDYSDDMGEKTKEKNNFLVTAIIPRDLGVKPKEKLDVVEKKFETVPEKAKKFTCELSIDFGKKPLPKTEQIDNREKIEEDNKEDTGNQFGTRTFDTSQCQIIKEKSLTFTKSKKLFDIKITKVEQKENNNNVLHQKMTVKFEKDAQALTDTRKAPKFEFNLALTGLGGNTKVIETERDKEAPQLQMIEEENYDVEFSPRTEWNDATEDMIQDEEAVEEELGKITSVVEEETGEEQNMVSEAQVEDTDSDSVLQDSLRYEKNLEFLQQKAEEREKVKEEEEVTKDKPSAILIQNGLTKLALIRYQ